MERTEDFDEDRPLDEKGLMDKAKMVQKCGMEGEEIYQSMRDVDENSSYFSVIVVKE